MRRTDLDSEKLCLKRLPNSSHSASLCIALHQSALTSEVPQSLSERSDLSDEENWVEESKRLLETRKSAMYIMHSWEMLEISRVLALNRLNIFKKILQKAGSLYSAKINFVRHITHWPSESNLRANTKFHVANMASFLHLLGKKALMILRKIFRANFLSR